MSCQCKCGAGREDNQYAFIDRIIEKYKDEKGTMIPILHEVQQEKGYLPEDVQAYIAQKMGVPLSEVYGIVTFYTLFNTQPKGKHKISVCLGTACYVRGAGKILEELEKELNIKVGQTTADGQFTLEACRCLGACGLAPVLTVDDHVHGRLTTKDVAGLIEQYKAEE
ncbi:MAG: NADH-quinone oxidoreductase subunit NuoE [Peptococcia bacterium]|jgi:NADP-reducing hydrogenase subunit HndA